MLEKKKSIGYFIAVDGPNGVGKSTLIAAIKNKLEILGYDVYVTREPTDTKLGNFSKAILESGIDLKGYFIYGFPGETKEDFQKTYELASKIKEISTNTTGTFRTSVFQFRPYHGTQLYNEIVKSTGIIHECEFNQSISKFEGRSQFNFDFGNYSKEKDEILNQYIIKTQELTKEEK